MFGAYNRVEGLGLVGQDISSDGWNFRALSGPCRMSFGSSAVERKGPVALPCSFVPWFLVLRRQMASESIAAKLTPVVTSAPECSRRTNHSALEVRISLGNAKPLRACSLFMQP